MIEPARAALDEIFPKNLAAEKTPLKFTRTMRSNFPPDVEERRGGLMPAPLITMSMRPDFFQDRVAQSLQPALLVDRRRGNQPDAVA